MQDGDDYSYVDFESIEMEEGESDEDGVYVPPNVMSGGEDRAALVETEGFAVTLDAQGSTVLVAEGGRPGLGSKAMAAAAKKGKYRSQVAGLSLCKDYILLLIDFYFPGHDVDRRIILSRG